MVDKMNTQYCLLAFFSQKDEDLVKIGSGRDPLGILSVWTSMARLLVPNLSGATTNLLGVKMVILIYRLYDHMQPKLEADKITLRNFFVIMEQVLEIFIFKNFNLYIYGIRILNSGDFSIKSHNATTFANGLYQFYRGALRRSNIITEDLLHLSTQYIQWFDNSRHHEKLAEHLAPFIQEIISSGDIGVGAVDELLSPQGNFSKLISAYFKDQSLNNLLKNDLLITDKQYLFEFAKLIAEIRAKDVDITNKELVDRCIGILENNQRDISEASYIKNALENIKRCEGFLVAVTRVFYWLQSMHNADVNQLQDNLKNLSDDLKQAAQKFIACNPGKEAENDHFLSLKNLAQHILSNDYKTFLTELVAYHQEIVKTRSDEALCLFENGKKLIVMDPMGKSETLESRFKDIHDEWDNDYYFWPAYKIYQHLYIKDPVNE